jgi:tagaturonate epimerase
MLAPLGLSTSFGFGDRLGLATPGQLAAVKGSPFAPVFAQQSVRENARTGRTPLQVLEDARRAVEAAGWEGPWGADADHLHTLEDLSAFVQAGYTFFTVDPGEHVDNQADTDAPAVLQEKAAHHHGIYSRPESWDELASIYLGSSQDRGFGVFGSGMLLRALVKYGMAIDHSVTMFRRLSDLQEHFDFEISVDETDTPTTPLEHYFIANELTRHAVKFTSLAPRFIGRFEKGVDYIGDLVALDAAMARHAAVTACFGTYKLSLHSGSDKFSVYPLLVKHWGGAIHVKTAGTSYLEALRVLAKVETGLFERIWALALERYPLDRASYHVSAELEKIPDLHAWQDLPGLLDDFQAREILHVTYGSALARFGIEIKAALVKHAAEYALDLERHFRKHLDLLV